MPHEHVNSSLVDATLDATAADPDHPNGVMRVPERITVIWNRPAAPHAYADPEDGYVQIISEWLQSEARFPTPEIVEVELRPHRFVSLAESDNDGERCAAEYCALPREHEIHSGHKVEQYDPELPHLFEGPKDSNTCLAGRCGRQRSHELHIKWTVKTEGEPTWSEPCTGLAVTLTRSDLNRLIKMLRRARDEAYGADA